MIQVTNRPVTNDTQLLRIYNYYRLFIGCLLGAMFWSGIASSVLGTEDPVLFNKAIVVYIVTSGVGLLLFWLGHIRLYSAHIACLLSVDFISFSLIIYASGGVNSSLSYLLLISMAIGSIIIYDHTYVALAAFAALLVLFMSVFKVLYDNETTHSIFTAGVTGILLFMTAFSFHFLAQKIRTSQQVAAEHAQYAANFQRWAQLIVERMQTGIVIVNQTLAVELINDAARHLLMLTTTPAKIDHIPQIHNLLLAWQKGDLSYFPLIFSTPSGSEVKVSSSAIESNGEDLHNLSLVLFIESTQQLNQQVQQLKLASLGRLTASIAHEIRNPLSAISHAGQLLGESDRIAEEDTKLVNMIQSHCRRIDHIIDNVLTMSKHKNANPEIIDLGDWVEQFKEEYLRHKSGAVHIDILSDKVMAKIDQNHLHQIMSNLVDNGLRYSRKNISSNSKVAQVYLHIGVDQAIDLPYIDVIDDGKGIEGAALEHLFEPFFTTETAGTGLGLYLSRELCQANQANLSYRMTEKERKSCFRIHLCHHERHI